VVSALGLRRQSASGDGAFGWHGAFDCPTASRKAVSRSACHRSPKSSGAALNHPAVSADGDNGVEIVGGPAKDGDMDPRNRQVLPVIWGIIVMVATSSCSRQPAFISHNASITNGNNLSQANEIHDIDKVQVTNIALYAAMTTNEDWPAAFVFTVQSNAMGWSVIVVRKPGRIGSHCTIKIDKKGKVIGYYGGM
jgi:hypothetical protein